MTKSDRGSIIIKMEASPPAEATSPPPAPAPVAAAPAPAAPAPAAGNEPPPKKAKKAKAKDDGATTRKGAQQHAPHAPPPEPPQCVGKWTIEETEFTTRIIELFNTGLLELPEGATLRSYLAQKLSCDPMRITKKFSGASCLGKRVFHSSTGRQRNSASAVAPSAASVAAAQQELSVLEARFVDACIRSTESKDARMIDLEARFLHSHDVVSTPAIDAFIMQSCQPLWDPDGVKSGGAPRARLRAGAHPRAPAAAGRRGAPPPGRAPPRAAAPPSFPPEPPSFPPARPPAAAPPRPAHHRVDAWPADARAARRRAAASARRARRRARARAAAMRAAPDPRAPHAAGHAAYAAPRRARPRRSPTATA
ncbi:hypothetical protein SO694_00009367 [Aureococcus anophagefferens]|uniref:Uncharacterized protein n=1 Tax=Aureococcus anophagefferens TaxID=44056 RepID=A0ABR1GEA1_AURAN